MVNEIDATKNFNAGAVIATHKRQLLVQTPVVQCIDVNIRPFFCTTHSYPTPNILCFTVLFNWSDTLKYVLARGASTQRQQQPFYSPLSKTTRVSQYQKKHSPTRHPDHHPIFISFFHLPRSIASSLFKLRAWQSFCTTSFHVLFGLPVGLEPSTSYSIHVFTQSMSSFRNTCP